MIHGERVRLRRVEREDLPRFVEWSNDPEVRDHLAAFYPMSLAQEERWFESTLGLDPACQPFALEAQSPLEPGASGPERLETGPSLWTHVGGLGFHQVDWKNRSAEFGIMIGHKSFWGAGYGSDATRAFMKWGFRVLNLNRVSLRVFEDNTRAIRSYQKVGFLVEGRLRQDRFHAGRYMDTLVMGLLRDELQ